MHLAYAETGFLWSCAIDDFLGLDILNELKYTYNTNKLKFSLSTAFMPKRGQLIFINI
ncbi:hypothetical protein PLAN_120292 [Planktothrix rubescens CCAP 1459/22]|uniref:Uncharacterized protein n=1 Tax=Planktothrix rubescens CCAP 1459/22 TaxID=329571 RepID=A0A6J7ZHR9_PLARU|nr:hypothetical protein PLAN_120292 [Planktothrix rubescens NIVA-CYA 18]